MNTRLTTPNNPSTQLQLPAVQRLRGPLRDAVRHFVQMAIAMILGMVLLGPLWNAAASVAGGAAVLARPDAGAMVMATNMSIAMAAWMRYRRHSWTTIAQMIAIMCAPLVLLLGPYWAGLLSGETLLTAGHLLMLPAMAIAMLLRRDEYTHDHGRDHNPPTMTEQKARRNRGGLRWLVRRWPTALAVAITAVKATGGTNEQMVTSLAHFVIVLQLNYVVMAQLSRRWLVWLNLPIAVALFVGVEAQPWLNPLSALIGLALAALLWGLARPMLRRSGTFIAQAGGMVFFSVLAASAVAAGPELSLYLTAAGWLAHGVWDFIHLWKDKVVARSFAEWCGVIDILLAAQLLLLS